MRMSHLVTTYDYATKVDCRACYSCLILLMKMGGKAFIGACSLKEALNLLFPL